jgi:hypothetical protein
LLEKAQGLPNRNQGGIAANGFTLLGPDRLDRRMEPVTYLIVRKLGHCSVQGKPNESNKSRKQ